MDRSSKSFFELDVWKKSHQLVLDLYSVTSNFPDSEIFSLTSQIRRAVISIPANIAEGYKRFGKADKIRFYNIAQSSLEEVRYYIFLSGDLGYIENKIELDRLVTEISKMLEKYIKQIELSKKAG